MRELSQVRELNTITFSYSNGDGSKGLFKGYTLNGFGFDVDAVFEDMVGGGGFGGKLTTLFSNVVLNSPPAFDIPRWFSYRGTNPVRFSVSCSLLLRTGNVNNDLIQPLINLFNLFLPSQSDFSGMAGSNATKVKEFVENSLQWLAQNTGRPSDKIYTLDLPPTMNPKNPTRLVMSYGPHGAMHIKDVIIRGVQVRIPGLTIEEGYPERIDLTISVETLRVATVQLFESFFTLQGKKPEQTSNSDQSQKKQGMNK